MDGICMCVCVCMCVCAKKWSSNTLTYININPREETVIVENRLGEPRAIQDEAVYISHCAIYEVMNHNVI